MFPYNLDNFMRASDITVVLGTSFTINTNVVPLEDYKDYIFINGTAFPPIVGTEQVFISINGTSYPLIDIAGNIVVAGRMRSGKFLQCGTLRPARYRLKYGSNGLPTAIPHFVVLEGLAPMVYNGSAGSQDNTTGE